MMRSFLILGGVLFAAGLAACSGSDSAGSSGGSDGTARSAGSAGSGGAAGMGGSAGVGGSAGTGGVGGVGGSAGMGGSGGMALAGACDNPSDLDAIAGAGDTLRNIGGDCGANTCGAHIFNPPMFAGCVSGCIETAVTGLSMSCSSCFGEVARCGLSAFCLACGSDTCGVECLNCVNGAGCLTALDACTGIPADACP